MKSVLLGLGVSLLLVSVAIGEKKSAPPPTANKDLSVYQHYENPAVCSGCHWEKFEQWSGSQMARAFTGDFFQAQYYQVALPSAEADPDVAGVKGDCIGCHSPAAYLAGDYPPTPAAQPDSAWKPASGNRTLAERGVFCDLCHTISGFAGSEPFNHNYVTAATPAIDPKRADLESPWSPYHPTETSKFHTRAEFCAICHDERNPFGVWVKATQREWAAGPYPAKNIPCQTCHMPPVGGKPAKMGPRRDDNTRHWFGGGFNTFVEGAAKVTITGFPYEVTPGSKVPIEVKVHSLATGHMFPSGAVEERDAWLRLAVVDAAGNELDHIPSPPNPADPNDRWFITSNARVAYPSHSKFGKPIARDSLPEGDRIYHSVFLDSAGQMTYAQWYAVKEVNNRFQPLEERTEKYVWQVPERLRGKSVKLQATLRYRRMPDSYAQYLRIAARPHVLVAQDEVPLRVLARP